MIVGVLGGIGAGKSTVARLFREEGAETVDADELAHAALEEPAVKQALLEQIGPRTLHPDGTVDRKVVAEHVFHDPARLQALEALVHPRVVRAIEERIRDHRARPAPRGLLVLDVPLLATSPLKAECDRLVFIEADGLSRADRVRARGWAPEELDRRERLQPGLPEKRRLAQHVIQNTSTLEETRRQVQALLGAWGHPERRK